MIDLIGKKFGQLTVLNLDHKQQRFSKKGTKEGFRYFYKCKCSCGNEKIINGESLVRGLTTSCGCYREKVFNHKKHNKTNTRLYNIWCSMKQRCYYTKHKEFKYWGGKGIIICDEWKSDFQNFYNWALNNGYDDNLSIDRIDGNKNYCPENCRWATAKEQANNQQRPKHRILSEELRKKLRERMLGNQYARKK